ncbi:class I SAM-dependent methyltransferase [Actinomadura madurae]|uniref:class I SAM-dependent methyltransferase n=1 Tax=Actinomadura madurae TaxID=1993 RepID=UPI0020D24086|nr:methyltransferase domain-containing protein [Actinomadura madurae]MCP9952036.1 hypothetical protein [Actinomadura madurae]MCP9968796.1 hypothetical protein [Actinomadura madurae]MCP9981275.1 hypothetical protein [Actinomadura madurae]
MDFDLYERELWAGRAPAYERGFAHVTRYMVEPLLDAAGVAGGTRFLDVGTGPGFVSREAVRRGAEVSALDAEPGMAETAARNVPGWTCGSPSCRRCRSATGRSTRSPATS